MAQHNLDSHSTRHQHVSLFHWSARPLRKARVLRVQLRRYEQREQDHDQHSIRLEICHKSGAMIVSFKAGSWLQPAKGRRLTKRRGGQDARSWLTHSCLFVSLPSLLFPILPCLAHTLNSECGSAQLVSTPISCRISWREWVSTRSRLPRTSIGGMGAPLSMPVCIVTLLVLLGLCWPVSCCCRGSSVCYVVVAPYDDVISGSSAHFPCSDSCSVGLSVWCTQLLLSSLLLLLLWSSSFLSTSWPLCVLLSVHFRTASSSRQRGNEKCRRLLLSWIANKGEVLQAHCLLCCAEEPQTTHKGEATTNVLKEKSEQLEPQGWQTELESSSEVGKIEQSTDIFSCKLSGGDSACLFYSDLPLVVKSTAIRRRR